MSGKDTEIQSDAQQLAQAFAGYVGRWAGLAGASPDALAAAKSAAEQASLAISEGHVCASLSDLAIDGRDVTALRVLLAASGVVGGLEASDGCPLIVDAEDRLYLHRYFDYEQRLARRLRGFLALPARQIDSSTRDRLATLFRPAAGDVDWQQVAAALALRQGLTIISGGPGTGKTTTVVNLLSCLLAQDPDCRIVLAAPTGKAAARMSEALRDRAEHLSAEVRTRLPTEASTIHRLLQPVPGGSFRHHAGNPLVLDVLVVDEASMLDLALATRLLEAVPASARVILLGDKDQLAAVESGAVFSELCADPTLSEPCRADLETACALAAGALHPPAPRRATGLQDCVVWLQRNYRFGADSGIGRLAAWINAGAEDAAIDWLRTDTPAGVTWHEQRTPQTPLQLAAVGFARFLETVRANSTDVDSASDAFNTFRVLCAVRSGPSGVAQINEGLVQHARKVLAEVVTASGAGANSPWFPGRPVMVLVNDPAMQLFNGDIGLTLPTADGTLKVFFPLAGGGWRAIAPLRLPAHETAFAMTVHKSQGSEFDEVLMVLPAETSRVLSRELVYTGVTRARSRVALWASEEAFRASIGKPTQRRTGLVARLGEER